MKRIIIKQMPDGCHVYVDGHDDFHGSRPHAKRFAKRAHLLLGCPVFNVKRSGVEVEVTPYPIRYITLPDWSEFVILHPAYIDGLPPHGYRMHKEDFVKGQQEAFDLAMSQGRGEWDLLLYAFAGFGNPYERHIYGQDNPYTQLRSGSGCSVKFLGRWSYMSTPRDRAHFKL